MRVKKHKRVRCTVNAIIRLFALNYTQDITRFFLKTQLLIYQFKKSIL